MICGSCGGMETRAEISEERDHYEGWAECLTCKRQIKIYGHTVEEISGALEGAMAEGEEHDYGNSI